MPTTHVRSADLKERWLLHDASGQTLGRLCSRIAMNLMGKDQPTYTPSEKNGAFVVVVNAEKVRVTGAKRDQKTYARYSGYPSGRKEIAYADLSARRPTEVVRLAVKRMLPKSSLGHDLLSRLKVYAGPEHPHSAQQPVEQKPVEVAHATRKKSR